ncbi:MAG: PD-(D/E)XK nuclease domain-containing protein, partial [Candidatus Sericytochromatia bacterium]|nr:PD-(D/E)XK nuclease domain-containing protein [Candidatus Tanganyikabacteria bacterium]
LDLRAEDTTSKGRIDLVLRMPGRVYILEFKVVDGPAEGKALDQIRERGYAAKCRAPGITVKLVGIEFSKAERNVVGFEVAEG